MFENAFKEKYKSMIIMIIVKSYSVKWTLKFIFCVLQEK